MDYHIVEILTDIEGYDETVNSFGPFKSFEEARKFATYLEKALKEAENTSDQRYEVQCISLDKPVPKGELVDWIENNM